MGAGEGARIREAYPSLALEVRNQRDMESFDQLLAGELDLAVRSREALPHGLRFEPLFASDRMLIVPRGHLRNPRSPCVRDPPGGFDVAPPDRGRVPAGRPEAGDRDGGGRLDVHGLVTREGTGASSATAAVTRLLEEAGRRVG